MVDTSLGAPPPLIPESQSEDSDDEDSSVESSSENDGDTVPPVCSAAPAADRVSPEDKLATPVAPMSVPREDPLNLPPLLPVSDSEYESDDDQPRYGEPDLPAHPSVTVPLPSESTDSSTTIPESFHDDDTDSDEVPDLVDLTEYEDSSSVSCSDWHPGSSDDDESDQDDDPDAPSLPSSPRLPFCSSNPRVSPLSGRRVFRRPSNGSS